MEVRELPPVDLTAAGSALRSGNVTGARSAFATLTQDLGPSATGTSGEVPSSMTGRLTA